MGLRFRQNVSLDEGNFEVVKDFKYLGSVLTTGNEVGIEVNEISLYEASLVLS